MFVTRRRRVRFVYAPEAADFGSTVMRGEQLAALAERWLGDRYDIAYEPTTTDFVRSTLFLTKGALKDLSHERLADLKRRGNRLLFDILDERPPPTCDLADVIVASSVSSLGRHGRAIPDVPVELVNHHVDPRLRTALARSERPTGFAAGYVGNEVNAILDDEVRSRVAVVQVHTDRRDDSWLDKVPPFTLHYALRRDRGLDDAKPFLKGFTAAACSAVVLVHESDAEALWWLGPDYPFIVRGERTAARAAEALDDARAAWGTPRWLDALDQMRALAARTTDERIAGELRALFA
jgi:hypothetical protein